MSSDQDFEQRLGKKLNGVISLDNSNINNKKMISHFTKKIVDPIRNIKNVKHYL